MLQKVIYIYIEDHSITYLNLQDKSGMKFHSENNLKEIVNYRNKVFEYT